jgi:hypothetical protein
MPRYRRRGQCESRSTGRARAPPAPRAGLGTSRGRPGRPQRAASWTAGRPARRSSAARPAARAAARSSAGSAARAPGTGYNRAASPDIGYRLSLRSPPVRPALGARGAVRESGAGLAWQQAEHPGVLATAQRSAGHHPNSTTTGKESVQQGAPPLWCCSVERSWQLQQQRTRGRRR